MQCCFQFRYKLYLFTSQGFVSRAACQDWCGWRAKIRDRSKGEEKWPGSEYFYLCPINYSEV